jgi:hypothetical protein
VTDAEKKVREYLAQIARRGALKNGQKNIKKRLARELVL